ncbi:MAG: SAM-dependent methyltransferase [Actinobacteria bacterium]|nr:SAM-dependent methyltransferase [Actinomycetota bacterium]
MPEIDDLLIRLFDKDALTRAVLSKPARRDIPAKVTLEPVDLRGEPAYRFTTHLSDRVTHENLPGPAARERLAVLLSDYRQGLLQSAEADWQVLGETILRRPASRPVASRAHDRRKRYLLEEGTPVPYLVELGVMTPEGQVRKSRYDKFRQVNRFLELVDDVVPALRADGPLRIVDFGCGKSYLTFALHHLLTELHGREVELVGLDLKQDVIDACSALARRSGAEGLRFERGEIGRFEPPAKIDLVVSLHACDTATDEALAQAVRWEADAILAVPCCQKEAYRQISSSLLQPLLRHGLARERFAALVTDTLRAQLLELAGYRTQLVEFVELEHTPKNVLVRAVRGRSAGAEVRRAYEELRDALGLEPTLERLLSVA